MVRVGRRTVVWSEFPAGSDAAAPCGGEELGDTEALISADGVSVCLRVFSNAHGCRLSETGTILFTLVRVFGHWIYVAVWPICWSDTRSRGDNAAMISAV